MHLALLMRQARFNEIDDAIHHIFYKHTLVMCRAYIGLYLQTAGIHDIMQEDNQFIAATLGFLQKFLALFLRY